MRDNKQSPLIDSLLQDEDYIKFIMEMYEDTYPDGEITEEDIESLLLQEFNI